MIKLSAQRIAFRVLSLPLLCLAAVSIASPAHAQIAVSSNDNKVVNVEGVNRIVENPAPDNVTIIDLGVSPPKIIGQIDVPGSVVGPPQSVAIAPDESLALVVASTKIDPADPKKTVPDNKLSVIDLQVSPHAVIATLEVGAAPAGVSFSPDGKLVLVTNRGEGTVSILTVSGKTLTPTGKIQLGDAKSGPSHIAFLPDGKSALVATAITAFRCCRSTAPRWRTPRRSWWRAFVPTASRSVPKVTSPCLPTRAAVKVTLTSSASSI